MTVYELMQLLRKHPPDLRVVVDGYEDGYDDLSPEQLRMVKDKSEHGHARVRRSARRHRIPARRETSRPRSRRGVGVAPHVALTQSTPNMTPQRPASVTQQLRPKERPGGVWRELRLGEHGGNR